jgi:hypothetical protein
VLGALAARGGRGAGVAESCSVAVSFACRAVSAAAADSRRARAATRARRCVPAWRCRSRLRGGVRRGALGEALRAVCVYPRAYAAEIASMPPGPRRRAGPSASGAVRCCCC